MPLELLSMTLLGTGSRVASASGWVKNTMEYLSLDLVSPGSIFTLCFVLLITPFVQKLNMSPKLTTIGGAEPSYLEVKNGIRHPAYHCKYHS